MAGAKLVAEIPFTLISSRFDNRDYIRLHFDRLLSRSVLSIDRPLFNSPKSQGY
jgi:hypothetical protein